MLVLSPDRDAKKEVESVNNKTHQIISIEVISFCLTVRIVSDKVHVSIFYYNIAWQKLLREAE